MSVNVVVNGQLKKIAGNNYINNQSQELKKDTTINLLTGRNYVAAADNIEIVLPEASSLGMECEIYAKNKCKLITGSVSYFLMPGVKYVMFWDGIKWKLISETYQRMNFTACCTNEVDERKYIYIGGEILDGITIETLFINGHYSSTGDSMTFTVNEFTAPIYIYQHGNPILFYGHEITADPDKFWFFQAGTTLRLMWRSSLNNGAGGWLILNGDDTVLSMDSENEGYTVKANGIIDQIINRTLVGNEPQVVFLVKQKTLTYSFNFIVENEGSWENDIQNNIKSRTLSGVIIRLPRGGTRFVLSSVHCE